MTVPCPFPWFGGKRRVAPEVWARFGDVHHYVEPFAGGLGVLLGRPAWHGRPLETVNDLDRWVANFWRAAAHDPERVAEHADYPVNEVDLHARHRWLVTEGRKALVRLDDDPDAFDAKVAGWWVWGLCAWIGGGWCAANGGDAKRPHVGRSQGTHRKRPAIGNGGRGTHRQRPQVGGGRGLSAAKSRLNDNGAVVNASAVQGRGARAERRAGLLAYLHDLADRLRGVRVLCGDWSRACTDAVVGFPPEGITGVLLDPPYGGDGVDRARCYGEDDLGDLSARVRARALELGSSPRVRVALCGYEEEHGPHMPATWTAHAWAANGGAKRRDGGAARAERNRHRERIWFSPACLGAELPLFEGVT